MNPFYKEYPIGTRIYITGTKHHGFRGEIIQRPQTPQFQGLNCVAVKLDEWPDEVFKFYSVNLIVIK